MQLTDTHCHIHFDNYPIGAKEAINNALSNGVTRFICVGTTLADSLRAADLAGSVDKVWASVGVHPHDAQKLLSSDKQLTDLKELINQPKVVAIGEIGLDYYKNYSPKKEQIRALKAQIEAGLPSGLPFIFHIRDAWDDFWTILDSYQSTARNIKGAVHSFSAHRNQLEDILKRGLYVGLNGIMTFTKDAAQLEAAKTVPLDRLVLETDAPFLTPLPDRQQVCEPKHVKNIAEFLANLRGDPLAKLAEATTSNAIKLFNLT